jgi:hypothetical protein
MTVLDLQTLVQRYEQIATIDIDGEGLGINRGKRRCIMSWAQFEAMSVTEGDAHIVMVLGLED